jgi:hypothetical protein
MGNVRVLLLCLFAIIYPVQLFDPSCTGKYNTNPIVQDEPTFISSVPNGKRYSVGSGYDKINILHVYGNTPYDMGYALGKMMSKELKELFPIYFDYLEKQVEEILKIVPPVRTKKILFFFVSDERFFYLLVYFKNNCRIRFRRCA